MKKIIIGILALLLVGGLIFLGTTFLNKEKETKFNSGFINGNTAGNLYNGGAFCEINGTVFFSNPSDAGKLYSMDSSGGNLKKLADDIPTYINADENYVYYVRNNPGDNLDFSYVAFYRNALVRIDHDGKNIVILDTEPSMYATLLGNYIYYLHYNEDDGSMLYKVRIDGSEQRKVSDRAMFTCNADGQYFYYNGMDSDGNIHRFDTVADTTVTVYEGNCFQPIVDGDDVYYIDGNTDYSIIHTNLKFNNPTYVTRDSVDAYNVYGSYIYYQRFDEDGSAFCVIKNDGTEFQIIREGDFCDIHVTSYYVFFREYHSGEFYYCPRSNPSEVELFRPGSVED